MNGETSGTNLALLAAGALATFFTAFLAVYALPLADSTISTPTEQTVEYTEEALSGKSVYDNEGCWFCHTQQVRPVPSDVGLGPATAADRYARDPRATIGLARIGPDLTCTGDRLGDADDLAAHLAAPRETRPRSVMPNYDHLDAEEMSALVSYLTALVCGGDS